MSVRLMLAAGLALSVGARATQDGGQAKAEVDAVVIDEKARQAAQAVAAQEADSKAAMQAADDASTREPATPR